MKVQTKASLGRLTPVMRQWIRDLDAGADPTFRLLSRSDRGGSTATIAALARHGLTSIDGTSLTDEGRALALKLRVCNRCGCTERDCSGCIQRTSRPCYWVKHNLCSACVPAARSR